MQKGREGEEAGGREEGEEGGVGKRGGRGGEEGMLEEGVKEGKGREE